MTGAIDWIWDVPKDQAERIKANPAIVVENAKTLRVVLPAVRRARRVGPEVLHRQARAPGRGARHRPRIAHQEPGRSGFGGDRTRACHPDQFACSTDVPKYAYDPAKAKALLKEAGFPDGFEFDLYAYRDREYTEAVIGDLAKVGLQAEAQLRAVHGLHRERAQGPHPGRARHLGLQLGARRVGHDGASSSCTGPDDLDQGPRGQAADRRRPTASPIPTSARPPGRRCWPASPRKPTGCRCSPTPSTTPTPRTSTSRRPPTRSRSSSRPSGNSVEGGQTPCARRSRSSLTC